MAFLKTESKTTTQVAKTFVLVMILTVAPSSPSSSKLTNNPNWTTCQSRDSLGCRCTSDVLSDVIASCHFNHVTDLRIIIKIPQDLVRLNLSANNIQIIPRHSFKNYTHLIYLSLSSNKIHTISQGAFSGLTRLQELNLRNNMIKQWDTKMIEQDLANLILLNVAQNIYWKPDQQILCLQNLRVIYLLWVENWHPFKCYIVRKNIKKTRESHLFQESIPSNIKDKVTPNNLLARSSDCWSQKVDFRNTSYWDVIDKNGFYFHCSSLESYQHPMNSTYAFSEHYLHHAWYYIIMIPYCWNTIQKIHIISLIVGICAMVFNLIVIITTLRSRVLRESVAHFLVANIAVGDLLASFYMIIITSTRQSMSEESYNSMFLPYYCRIVGSLFLTGQLSSPGLSFIMTLERYLAVVYCMRPQIRITRRMTYVAMVIVWSFTISLVVSFMTSLKFSRETEDMCIPMENSEGKPVIYYLAGIGVILYIISMALYGHMYLDFKKTNQKTVQLQRENRMARRIALIMFTNVLFVIFPLIIAAIVAVLSKDKKVKNIFDKTFAITCLCVNSCFNPILFSFRNERFRDEVRKIWSLRRSSIAPQVRAGQN